VLADGAMLPSAWVFTEFALPIMPWAFAVVDGSANKTTSANAAVHLWLHMARSFVHRNVVPHMRPVDKDVISADVCARDVMPITKSRFLGTKLNPTDRSHD
jgi:hypothetical protein